MNADILNDLAARVEALDGDDRRTIDRLDRTGDCWAWTGALDARGRGRVWRNGKLKLHHRAVWEILIGPIPAGALLCHHCDNPTCGNPAHLYVGDGKTNVADMFGRGRAWQQRDPEKMRAFGRTTGRRNNWARGQCNPKAKLTAEKVAEIVASSMGSRELGKLYGVHRTTIQRIRGGALWPAIRAHAAIEKENEGG